MNQTKNAAIWVVVFLAVAVMVLIMQPTGPDNKAISFTEFLNAVEEKKVTEVLVAGERVYGQFSDNQRFVVDIIDYPNLVEDLRAAGVKINVENIAQASWYISAIFSAAPILLLAALWFYMMRQMQNGGSKALSFGKSRARLISDPQGKATFKDVAGVDEAKEDLQEIIEFLRDPHRFQRLGGKIPKGVLLIGPPGTGKTLLAKAIAGEANVPFFSISGSDFVEMFVGVGASRVRDLFEQAKKNAPCIIFVDEIDAVGRHRGAGLGGGHDEREQTLNQLLVEMDGFEDNSGTILIAATNRPDVLDPALLRPGRFDRRIVVPRPDIGGREAILKVHTAPIPLSSDVDLKVIARGTPGFTGADLANLCNEGALLAAREDATMVTMQHFERSKDKVLMGAERRSMIISDKEKKTTAVHEAGHALVAVLLPGADPIHKVTIIPRGQALGLTQQLPVDEKHTHSRDYLLNQLVILMGGRVAEEIVLDQKTTGASNDIERATQLARKMVCEWGMNDDLGPVAYGQKEEQIFLGREIAQHRDYSESTAIAIDKAVNSLVTESHNKARAILVERRAVLDKLTEILLDVEVIDGDDIQRVLEEDVNGGPLPRDDEPVENGPSVAADHAPVEGNSPGSDERKKERPRRPEDSGLEGYGGMHTPALP
ncbi:MAG: ATP-dependent zinc metalloprotease FtsH [Nitrospinota bacterium]|nr:ATP-dependent zinc metalloprotease FtsH [Nitrospinota bacterium]MDH5757343.1 ATP-dependent zinc metalloprotease FtsH [Nitrospinota bacterium]